MTQLFEKKQTRSRFCVSVLFIAVAIPAMLVTAGCRGKNGTAVQNDEGEPPAKSTAVSSLKMDDATAAAQLVKGFSAVESGAWRWTAGSFSVLLKTPPDASTKGGKLTFKLNVADAVLKQVHTQTLSASIGGKPLHSEKYTAAGNYTFEADVPAASLTGDTVTVDFTLDNPLPPGQTDRRELGLIAMSVGIESK